jgi:hypothetical protein
MITVTENYNSYLAREIIYPKWKLLSFNPASDTWAEIISGTYGQTPVDLTEYVARIDHTFDRMQVTMQDDSSLVFHPDGGALRTALAQGRIVRLYEGFEGLAESEWLVTFTGTIEGSYSWAYQRGEFVQIQFTVFNRANNQAWKRRNVTSNSFTIGSDWGSMFSDIAKNVMLLEDAEVVVPEPWGVLFDKNSNQVVNYPPWDAMEQLTFGINAVPFFNGKGELDLYYITQNRITHSLEDDKYLRRYEAKGGSAEIINKVILTYLSNELSRVDGPDQILASATCTVGFFKREFDIPVYYSDERKTRSDNPRFIVKASANAGLLNFCTEEMEKIDEFHSNIHVEVSVWAPILATVMLAAYVVQQAIPRPVIVAGVGASTGTTITLQDVIAAVTLIGILLIMMCLGTGQYEVWGIPYEMVYLEQQAIALKAGTEFWQEREKEIRNDFVSTLEQAQPLVVNQLHYEVMKENPRILILRYDPRIEPGDVIEVSTGVKIWVESVQRQIGRANGDTNIMTVQGYRTVL